MPATNNGITTNCCHRLVNPLSLTIKAMALRMMELTATYVLPTFCRRSEKRAVSSMNSLYSSNLLTWLIPNLATLLRCEGLFESAGERVEGWSGPYCLQQPGRGQLFRSLIGYFPTQRSCQLIGRSPAAGDSDHRPARFYALKDIVPGGSAAVDQHRHRRRPVYQRARHAGQPGRLVAPIGAGDQHEVGVVWL